MKGALGMGAISACDTHASVATLHIDGVSDSARKSFNGINGL